jgi:hypothetical protein
MLPEPGLWLGFPVLAAAAVTKPTPVEAEVLAPLKVLASPDV